MGQRGPAPKPPELEHLHGHPGRRSSAAAPRGVPAPPGKPTRPSWLPKEAARHWRATLRHLEALGLSTPVDGDALAAYCIVFARWKAAELALAEHGLTVVRRNDAGVPVSITSAPELAVAEKALEQLRRLQREFGLTPSARSSVQLVLPMGDEDSGDELDAWERDHESPQLVGKGPGRGA